MDVKGRKAEQSEATRGALLKAARALFAEHGYAEAPTEEIVRRAGVTRGALYHHFRDKQDLFRAVYEELEQEFVERVAAASAGARGGALGRLTAGVDAFLDACLEPAVQRITLLDAPSVLGREAHRALEERYGLALVKGALENAMAEGVIERQPVEPLAHLLLSALIEAGMLVATAEDQDAMRRKVRATIQRLLEGLSPGR